MADQGARDAWAEGAHDGRRPYRRLAVNAPQPKIRCREIRESDIDAVADLLTRGFAGRARDYWIQGLRRQAAREVPSGYSRFGYMLDHDGTPVGVLLLIYSFRDAGGEAAIHCNLSSWYVEPAYRNYAPMLTKIAQRHKHVTYLNISPATWTWPIIETQGFSSYCKGLFFSIPALSRAAAGTSVEIVSPDAKRIEGLSAAELERLTVHPATDADPPRLDRPSGGATDLLPRRRRICRLRRRHRPAAAATEQGGGDRGFGRESARPDRPLHRSARPQIFQRPAPPASCRSHRYGDRAVRALGHLSLAPLLRGEGWGGALPPRIPIERGVPLTRIASQSDLSPQAGRDNTSQAASLTACAKSQ